MAKEQENPEVQDQEQAAVGQKPIDTLLKDGEVTLTAESREDIYSQGDALIADIPEGKEWTRSFVEYKEGAFTQTYYIKK